MKLDEVKVGFASMDFLTLLIPLCTVFDQQATSLGSGDPPCLLQVPFKVQT
jgi:hypothetical protein